ncbi:unnamed protein product [Prunus brigantina]
MDIRNPAQHIDRVVQSPEDVRKNRLRLTTTIEAIRYLANQGMALESIYISMMSFDFAFALLLLDKTMGFTDFLCQALQSKSQDIIFSWWS